MKDKTQHRKDTIKESSWHEEPFNEDDISLDIDGEEPEFIAIDQYPNTIVRNESS